MGDAIHADVLEIHVSHIGALPNGNIFYLIKESEDLEASDACDELVQKGRETKEPLTVNAEFMNVIRLLLRDAWRCTPRHLCG